MRPVEIWVRATAGALGAVNVVTSLLLLLAPAWFYANVADYPPYNRHFLGDAGAFILAIGMGLLLAARDPVRHRSLIGIGAVGTALHAVNHLYDDVLVERLTSSHWLTASLPIALMALALAWAWWAAGRIGPKTAGTRSPSAQSTRSAAALPRDGK
jgi:hypothetical protein